MAIWTLLSNAIWHHFANWTKIELKKLNNMVCVHCFDEKKFLNKIGVVKIWERQCEHSATTMDNTCQTFHSNNFYKFNKSDQTNLCSMNSNNSQVGNHFLIKKALFFLVLMVPVTHFMIIQRHTS